MPFPERSRGAPRRVVLPRVPPRRIIQRHEGSVVRVVVQFPAAHGWCRVGVEIVGFGSETAGGAVGEEIVGFGSEAAGGTVGEEITGGSSTLVVTGNSPTGIATAIGISTGAVLLLA